LDYSRFSNWIVIRGSVDLIDNGFYDFYSGNGLYVDLDGSTHEGGKLESKKNIALSPGNYKLQFDIGNNSFGGAENTVITSLGDAYKESFTLSGKTPYRKIIAVPHRVQCIVYLE
jgi:hypothetical protein